MEDKEYKMATADKLRKLIQLTDKNIERLEFEVDCIVKDLRRGKPSGFNVKKVTKAADAKVIAAEIEKNIETIKKLERLLEKAQKAAEATEKAVTLSAVLNAMSSCCSIRSKVYNRKFKVRGKRFKICYIGYACYNNNV